MKKNGRMDLEVELVTSISEVLGKHLFSKEAYHHRDCSLDIFVVHVVKASDIVEFLGYVRKYKPDLPMIILSDSPVKTSLLKSIFKPSTVIS